MLHNQLSGVSNCDHWLLSFLLSTYVRHP
uniref:Uncharacterized protein n=1 Tax=Rhizophora mucronata TaxID=61149 RepID=A0A2P2NRZ1_RHIMU